MNTPGEQRIRDAADKPVRVAMPGSGGPAADLWSFLDEHLARQADLDKIRRLGVTGAAVAKVGGIGLCSGTIGRGDWVETGGRDDYVLIPVFDGYRLFDLVAFSVRQPTDHRRYFKSAAVLDAGALSDEWSPADPVRIFRDPLRWLHAECDGVVPLDWPVARELLRHRDLVAEDAAHGHYVKKMMQPDAWRGRVLVRRECAA